MSPSELETALGKPTPGTSLPPELPLAHLTAARWLEGILDAKELRPRDCKVFQSKLLYFSYGGVFYRISKLQTENVTELPVALVFTPTVMDICSKLFPFDSGAMAQKLYGDSWYSAMKPFEERFSISNDDLSTTARLLVHKLFGTNAAYVEGRPADQIAASPPALNLLHSFLKENLSNHTSVPWGIDGRQRSIELLSSTSISIADKLIWIGLPLFRSDDMLTGIRKFTRTIPQIYTYRHSRNFNPDQYAADLQRAAQEQVINRYSE